MILGTQSNKYWCFAVTDLTSDVNNEGVCKETVAN